MESGILHRLTDFFGIQKLRSEIFRKHTQLAALTHAYKEALDILKEIELELLDRKHIATLKAKLAIVRIEQEEEKEERCARDVSEVMREHRVLLTHGFAANDKTRSVTVMREGTGWSERLNVALGLAPEIPTTSIKEGTQEKPYYLMGVLLKGGEITQASVGDLGSHVSGVERLLVKPMDKAREQIARAIKRHGFHNEILVREPQFAGLFLDWELLMPTDQAVLYGCYGETSAEVARNVQELTERADTLGMPIYIRAVDGRWHIAVRDQDAGAITKGEPASIDEIMENTFILDEAQRQTIREQIFENSPFKLKTDDYQVYHYWKRAPQLLQDLLRRETAPHQNADDRISTSHQYVDIGWGTIEFDHPITSLDDFLASLPSYLEKWEKEQNDEIAKPERS